MGKTIRFIQQSLNVGDEDMPAILAGLYPKASKIADAAATFIDSADKVLRDDKTIHTQPVVETLVDAMSIAQEIVRQSAAMNRLIRNPYQTQLTLMHTADTTEEETGETEAERAVA